MLKKLTATGIAAAAAGFVLLGGTANADRLSAGRSTHRPTAYYPGHHYGRSGWNHRHHHWIGWGRWHHGNRHHHRFHH